MRLLDGKVAVVTGAGRGLGRSHALTLASFGARVVVNDLGTGRDGSGRDPSSAAAVVDEIRRAGGEAEADGGDVSSFEAAGALVDRALALFGRVDIVVNNAGVSRSASLEELDEALLDLHLGVHLKGTIGTTRAVFPVLRRQGGGRIINTVSGAGLRPEYPGAAAYACAKAAVYAFTRVAALEGAPHGITVNAISPLARTRMSEEFFDRTQPGSRESLEPGHASTVVAYLASDLARDVTGRIVRVEGGHVCEARMLYSEGIRTGRWTPETLAVRIREIFDD